MVTLRLDIAGEIFEPDVGDYLISNGGSVYVVMGATPSPRNPRRFALRCQKLLDREGMTDQTRIIYFAWHKRKRKVRR